MFITLSVLLAAACLFPAVAKLSNHPKVVASAGHFGIPWSRYRLIGVAELAAAAAVVAGLAWVPIGIAAASGMALLLLGALAVHLRSGDRPQEAAPALVALAMSLGYLAVTLTRCPADHMAVDHDRWHQSAGPGSSAVRLWCRRRCGTSR